MHHGQILVVRHNCTIRNAQIVVFWVVTSRSFADGYQCLEEPAFSRKSSDVLLSNVSWNLEWQISKPIHNMSIMLDIVHHLKHFLYAHSFGNWIFPWSGVKWKRSCSVWRLERASLNHETLVASHIYEYCTIFAVASASINKQNSLFILHNHHPHLSYKFNNKSWWNT